MNSAKFKISYLHELTGYLVNVCQYNALSAEFKKEAEKISSEIKKAEEKEVKETVKKAKETSVVSGVSLVSILGGKPLSRIERLNIIEKTGQENAGLSDAKLIEKAN